MKDTNGYDKLKPFCFHGCIDGYSQRIIRLEVGVPKNEQDVTVVSRMMWNSLRRRVACTSRSVTCSPEFISLVEIIDQFG